MFRFEKIARFLLYIWVAILFIMLSAIIIKPSSITCDFENRVNPKTIKRKARHKRIETTLRYDHTDDNMVRQRFEERDLNIDHMSLQDKQRLLFNRYLSGEIDLDMLKNGLDTFNNQSHRKNNEDVGYA